MVDLFGEEVSDGGAKAVSKGKLYSVTVEKKVTVEKDRIYRAEIEVRAETEKEAEETALEMAEDLDDVDWDEEDESEEEETDEEIRFPEDEEYIEIIDENPGDDGMSEEAFEKIYGKTREQALKEAQNG